MRAFLVGLVVLESVVLVAAGCYVGFGDAERLRRHGRSAPVFRPPFYDAAMGDTVLYRVEDPEGNVTGYFEYKVVGAVVYPGTTFGRDFTLLMTDLDRRGRPRRPPRQLHVRPKVAGHGWLPPRFEDGDDYPSGARPVVKSIRSLPAGDRPPQEFLVEAVVPRESLTAVAQRFWITPAVPVFGVRRWERGDVVLVRHSSQFGEREP